LDGLLVEYADERDGRDQEQVDRARDAEIPEVLDDRGDEVRWPVPSALSPLTGAAGRSR
jgi:hypothetical protein